MPDHLPNRLKHLKFTSNAEPLNFRGQGHGQPSIRPVTNRAGHVSFRQGQVTAVQQEFERVEQERHEEDLSSDFGLILNVVSEPGFPLVYESLEKAPTANAEGIALLNIRREQTAQGEVTKAAIFVPHGQLSILEKKITEYADPTKDSKDRQGNVTNPRNAPLLNNIHSISAAAVDALWTDPDPLPRAEDVVWFELWIRRDDQEDWQAQLSRECELLEMEVPDQTLILPDHIIMIGRGTRAQLESSLDLLNCLSEIRKARPCNVGLTDLNGLEQEEWIDEAYECIDWPADDAPAVCLLDTGVNRGHPLIEPMLSHIKVSGTKVLLGVVEDQNAAVVERDLFGLPGRTLVVALGLRAGGVPFLLVSRIPHVCAKEHQASDPTAPKFCLPFLRGTHAACACGV
jgi:hypothetical protein